MGPAYASSTLAIKNPLRFARAVLGAVVILAIAPSARGQASTPKSGPSPTHVRWRKYSNPEYGFSFGYPETYRPSSAGDRCTDNENRRYLLCLERRDNSDARIWVTLVIAEPFKLSPDVSGAMPRRRVIGRHVFYWQVVGSLAVGRADNYYFYLKGKTLEFEFEDGEEPSQETRELESELLKTLRVF